MSVDLILFFALALVAIAAAIGMLVSQNAVFFALFLVINFATMASLLLGAVHRHGRSPSMPGQSW
jgi:NADH:ubiquinone oxidoreductase subunit 6 (subunit J)